MEAVFQGDIYKNTRLTALLHAPAPSHQRSGHRRAGALDALPAALFYPVRMYWTAHAPWYTIGVEKTRSEMP